MNFFLIVQLLFICVITQQQESNNSDKKDNENEGLSYSQKVGIGLVAAGGVAVIGAALPLLMGFSAAGVVGGSIAAGLQSGFSAISAGSLFATAQSLAATGALTAIMTNGGLAVAAGASIFKFGDDVIDSLASKQEKPI